MNRNLRIGIFSAIGVGLIVGFSLYVNDHPYWYRPCNAVKIHVDDATGLRRKSPVKTLGLEIGYINEVTLDGDKVLVTVCVTGPVKLTADTKAFIRSQGFLGDKFLELKPVVMSEEPFFERNKRQKREDGAFEQPESKPPEQQPSAPEKPAGGQGQDSVQNNSSGIMHERGEPIYIEFRKDNREPSSDPLPDQEDSGALQIGTKLLTGMIDWIIPSASAADDPPITEGKTLTASREAEFQDTIKKVGKLLDQLTLMVGDLREVTQQKEFKETIKNINAAMKHLEVLLRPDGKTVMNINDAVVSLKNTMKQAEEVMKKINSGEGTLGKFVTDPSIFDEMKAAVKSINLLLGKAGSLHTYVDLSAVSIPAYDGTRGKLAIQIAPNPTRYYLLGVSNDPRGRTKKTTTVTTVNGGTPSTEVKTVNEEKGIKITALFGKYFGGLDLRAGVINDDGAVGIGYWFDSDRRYGIHVEGYSPGKDEPFTARIYARVQPVSAVYFTGGVDTIRRYNGRSTGFFGAGVFFDDEDLRYLLAFK